RELGLEGIGVCFGREVAAKRVSGITDRVRDPVDHLADSFFPRGLVPVQPGLAEILGDDDVRRELAPIFRDRRSLHLEDDRATRIRDAARPALEDDFVEGIDACGRVATRDGDTGPTAPTEVGLRGAHRAGPLSTRSGGGWLRSAGLSRAHGKLRAGPSAGD